jgi:hypothetical protein
MGRVEKGQPLNGSIEVSLMRRSATGSTPVALRELVHRALEREMSERLVRRAHRRRGVAVPIWRRATRATRKTTSLAFQCRNIGAPVITTQYGCYAIPRCWLAQRTPTGFSHSIYGIVENKRSKLLHRPM